MSKAKTKDAQPLGLRDADRHALIRVQGARVNNLKDVSELPKRRLMVFTGVSGSGKSSLVFGALPYQPAIQHVLGNALQPRLTGEGILFAPSDSRARARSRRLNAGARQRSSVTRPRAKMVP